MMYVRFIILSLSFIACNVYGMEGIMPLKRTAKPPELTGINERIGIYDEKNKKIDEVNITSMRQVNAVNSVAYIADFQDNRIDCIRYLNTGKINCRLVVGDKKQKISSILYFNLENIWTQYMEPRKRPLDE